MEALSLYIVLSLNLLVKMSEAETSRSEIFEITPFHLLNTKAVATTAVASDLECALPCSRRDDCLSFNIAVVAEGSSRLCQLLSTTNEQEKGKFYPSKDFHHFTKTTACRGVLCPERQRCIVNAEGVGYHCVCLEGLTGDDCETAKWIKVTSHPVSFGARDDQPGVFQIQETGKIITFKLVHVSGFVSVDNSSGPIRRGNWQSRCPDGSADERLAVIITDKNKNLVIPELSQMSIKDAYLYKVPGYNGSSPYLVYLNLTTPRPVYTGEEFQVWLNQDLLNDSEYNNEGIETIDVYAWYV
ncbi:uncharacterized protein LOC116615290 [Nematostella vectensis]|uniref:uncharacterized protein LOC116615290 n=1 Tax=Nematostella vectensis TaxID=45351 RepID=UPI0013904D86|nr:uncharacterized protein LOC116615290 [Nematostella vectensis]